jgi:hypothetical protein
MDHEDLSDIRPSTHVELMRYCCEIQMGGKGERTVFFKMNNTNYRWTLCKPDLSILTNDSLNHLTFKEKLAFVQKQDSTKHEISSIHRQLPFQVEKGYVYQIYGFPNLEGSYYFCLSSGNELVVQYVDAGPW